MQRLRFWIAILSVWLIFFFNIERILFRTEVNIIRSDTYIFVATVALISLLLPRLRGVSFAILLIVPTALFLFLWYHDPFWKKVAASSSNFAHLNSIVLLTLIQVNAIILTGLLARQITYRLSEFEGVIANITFGHIGQRPHPFSEEQSAMYREIKRARRYERPLAVMAFKIDEDTIQVALPQMVKEVQKGMMKEYTLAGLARILNDSLQGFDTIALSDNHFIAVLPETTSEEAPHIAQRLEKAIKEKMDVKVHIGTASFPDQAMTFESLVELALTNAEQHRPDIEFNPRQNLKHKPQLT